MPARVNAGDLNGGNGLGLMQWPDFLGLQALKVDKNKCIKKTLLQKQRWPGSAGFAI